MARQLIQLSCVQITLQFSQSYTALRLTYTRHSRLNTTEIHTALIKCLTCPRHPRPPKAIQKILSRLAKKEARRTKAHRSGPLPLSPLAPHALSPYARLTYAAHRSRLSPRGHLAGTGHPATLLATLHPWPPPARRKRLAVWDVNQRRAAGRLAAWAARRQVRRRWRCLAPRAGREAPSLGPGSG